MGQGGEPRKIDYHLPMEDGKSTTKLGIAADEKSNTGHQLLIAKHENSGAECWLPNLGRFRTISAPYSINDASVYTIQEVLGDVANNIVDTDDG